jgi:DNA-binding NtrC family response regulator
VSDPANQPIRLLFVDDEKDFVEFMSIRLRRHDLDVAGYTNARRALEETEGRTFDVGLLDLKMPEMDGVALLRRLKERDPDMQVIILTGHGSIESAFAAGKMSAYDYLLKPCDFDELVRSISNAYAKRIKRLQAEKTKRVDSVMKRALGMSPLDLLNELKKVNDSLSMGMLATSFAEEGDHDTARQILENDQTGRDRKQDGEEE